MLKEPGIWGRTKISSGKKRNDVLKQPDFWEDRYHATAIETGEHLLRCLVYVDLNMVRSGVVSHPEQWTYGDTTKSTIPGERTF